MTIHHQAHQDRVTSGLGVEWDRLPPSASKLTEISNSATDVRFRRVGASHRGIGLLRGMRRLWAHAVDQSFLEEICSVEGLEVLHLEKVTAADLSLIRTLPRLQCLSIIGAPTVKDLTWLPTQRSIRALAIENAKHLFDLSELAQLSSLRALAIEGSMWTAMRVASLKPISALESLEFLFLTNTRVADQSLEPLHRLRKLRTLHCARFFQQDEFARLKQALPQLKCNWFDEAAWKNKR